MQGFTSSTVEGLGPIVLKLEDTMRRRCGSAGMLVSLDSPIVVDDEVSRRCVSVGCFTFFWFAGSCRRVLSS
jgi:hypothetical protein